MESFSKAVYYLGFISAFERPASCLYVGVHIIDQTLNYKLVGV